MHVIYKYPITPGNTLAIPTGAKILSTQYQRRDNGNMELVLWALVDTDQPLCFRNIHVYGTGWKAGDAVHLIHLATLQVDPLVVDTLVWHFFISPE